MVPLLTSVEGAKDIVKWSKFPPLGRRGWGSPFPMNSFSTKGSRPELSAVEYMQQANDSLLTVVQIETAEALDCAEEIAAVPGIDVLFVGPFDLGNNIGAPILQGVQSQTLKDAIKRVHAAAIKAGKKSGIYCVSGEQAREYSEMGFHMVRFESRSDFITLLIHVRSVRP
jgi:4-hydroxy-2-oxoheptanedioate aldolase